MIEEMLRDRRVIFYGEDVADYGGAFKVTKGLLEAFGRERVFNTPISEAAICGTAVGAAMVGLRPVVELMYMDFALMASDQISNQAAKWHYMSRRPGRGAAGLPRLGRRRQGLRRAALADAWRACSRTSPGSTWSTPPRRTTRRACSSRAIRDNNPVMFVESQGLYYGARGRCPRTTTSCRSAWPT